MLLNIRRSGYAVSVVPHASLRDARVVTKNPAVMMGTLIVSGFRVPARAWQAIVRRAVE